MQRIYIICYHRISNDNNSYLRPTKVDDFERQMEYLRSKYNPIPLESIIENIKSGRKLPKKAVAVTFDDGYRDNYINAYPILKKYGIPATVFLTVGYIGTNKLLPWDKIYNIFELSKVKNKNIMLPMVKDYNMSNSKKIVYDVYRKMKLLNEGERESLIADLSAQLDIQDIHNDRLMLSWDEIILMSNDGISFGSHTLTHPLLTKVQQKKAYEEMAISKKVIEQNIGKDVKVLAYPEGDFNPVIANMAKNVGYLAAVSTIPGFNNLKTDLFFLRRNVIYTPKIFKFSRFLFEVELIGLADHLRKLYYQIK